MGKGKPSTPSDPTPVGCATAACPNALSPDQAQQLFGDLASDPAVPFDYPDDCCYSRAHHMARTMRDRGIPNGKVWNYAGNYPNGAGLRADTPNHPSGHVNWRYHVAPTVPVRGADGVVRNMVMDPSMFDRPVTVAEWVQAQHDPNSRTEFTDANPYFRGPADNPEILDPANTQTDEMLEQHRESRDRRRAAGP